LKRKLLSSRQTGREQEQEGSKSKYRFANCTTRQKSKELNAGVLTGIETGPAKKAGASNTIQKSQDGRDRQ